MTNMLLRCKDARPQHPCARTQLRARVHAHVQTSAHACAHAAARINWLAAVNACTDVWAP